MTARAIAGWVGASVLLVLGAPERAEACSCDRAPPCEVFWRFELVFTGKVTHLARVRDGVVATFAIDEKFRGPFAAHTLAVHDDSMCGIGLELGREYFVYAYDDAGVYRVASCSTRLLADAGAHLAYARKPVSRSHGLIEGEAFLVDEQDQIVRHEGIELAVRGTSARAVTSKAGTFQLRVPAAGTYDVEAVDPALRVVPGSQRVEVPHVNACVQESVKLEYNGRIRGRVVDPTGRPVANVRVWATGAGKTAADRGASARTDARGEFELAGVPAGTFHVTVGHRRYAMPSADQPYPITFHPSTPNAKAARVITVARSGLVTGVDIRLPAALPVVEVTGLVRHAGAPAAEVRVGYTIERTGVFDSTYTDAAGAFAIRVLAGSVLDLQVCRIQPTGPDACVKSKVKVDRTRRIELAVP